MRAQHEGPLFVGLGEVLFDQLPGGDRLGGAPANFAYTAHALGYSAAVVSAVGNDVLGCRARRMLREKGILSCLGRVERPTGYVGVSLDEAGVPAYAFRAHPAYEAIPWSEAVRAMAARTGVCCFGTLAQWGRISRRTVRQFLQAVPETALRVYDVNLRGHYYSRGIVESSLALADVVKCSEEELPVLCRWEGIEKPDPAVYFESIRRLGVSCFIYTEGAKGSRIYREEEVSVRSGLPVAVADTVGAGDAFSAAFAAALVQGIPLVAAHAIAEETAAFVCMHEGAMPEYPDRFRIAGGTYKIRHFPPHMI